MVLIYDLYCGAGGVGLALDRLGFDSIGVDIDDFGDTYPGQFVRADASRPPLSRSPDLLWLSPPCQLYSALTQMNVARWGIVPEERYDSFEDLRVREVIDALDPAEYIIENVPRCGELRDPTRMNGLAFGKPYRIERHFETSFPCPDSLGRGTPTLTMSTRTAYNNTKSQRKELARAKGVPEDWPEQQVHSAIPTEYVQYLLHYCPSTPNVSLPAECKTKQTTLP